MKRYVSVIRSTMYPVVLLCTILGATTTIEADEHVFRIGTGGNAGTYLPIGTLIAQALNEYDVPRSSNVPLGEPLYLPNTIIGRSAKRSGC